MKVIQAKKDSIKTSCNSFPCNWLSLGENKPFKHCLCGGRGWETRGEGRETRGEGKGDQEGKRRLRMYLNLI